MSEPVSSREGGRAAGLGCAALLLAFLAAHGARLASYQHLIDEGTNVYAAHLVQRGLLPFRDFFYHQPPAYLYLLTLLPTDHFVWGRIVSLVASCGSGVVLFLISRRLLRGPVAPLLPVLLFQFAGLQYYGLLALPNACMLFFALLGTHLVFYARRRRALAGAAAIVVAVLFKPIAIPVIFAILLALWFDPARRPDALRFALAVGAGAVLSLSLLHLTSGGAFTELVRLQSERYAQQSVFQQLQQLPLLRRDLRDYTPLSLNFDYHRYESFRGVALLPWLLLAPGVLATWRRRSGFTAPDRVLWCAWLLLLLASVFFVWDVSWPHYHLLYLPPLAILAGAALDALLQRGRIGALAALAVCLVYAVDGTSAVRWRQRDYSAALALRGETAPLLAFDPTVNVLSRTESPCGLVNHLAQLSGVFQGGSFARFNVDPVRCLETSPEVKVVIHRLADTSLLFIDRPLYDAILRLPPERVLYLERGDRKAFLALGKGVL